MTGRFDRIEEAFEDFRSKVVELCDGPNLKKADIQDAYDRLNRLRDRYWHEAYRARSLNSTEREALQKVFEENAFIEGMCKLRVIAHHVTGDLLIYDINYSAFELVAGTSGATAFAKPRVTLIDKNGQSHDIDHLKSLTQAVDLIARAMAKAKASRTDAP
jgi:hypothetical protein